LMGCALVLVLNYCHQGMAVHLHSLLASFNRSSFLLYMLGTL
jgi:hypothetical protein